MESALRALQLGHHRHSGQMKVIKHPFFVEFVPESVEELRVARVVFDGKGNNRTVFAVAAAEFEQDDVIAKFQAAMKAR